MRVCAQDLAKMEPGEKEYYVQQIQDAETIAAAAGFAKGTAPHHNWAKAVFSEIARPWYYQKGLVEMEMKKAEVEFVPAGKGAVKNG